MFKSWRNDKKKIKAVFKLQFQATQVPRLKKSSLIISLVPEDVGKTTFKLEKAAVQDGTCSWENPVFVAVKLVREHKSGKLHEKIYHFIVSSGSSKSGYLGECSIDFSDFAEETEPLTVSLPLKFANSGAILHVTIQKVQEGLEPRHIEDSNDPRLAQDRSLKSQLSNTLTDENRSAEEEILDILSISDDEQEANNNASFNSNTTSQTILRLNSMPQDNVDASITNKRLHRRSNTDWSLGSDGSLVDSTKSPEDNYPRALQGNSDESIGMLKDEISNLMRQSELTELELQSLRKQVVKESRQAQDISRQLIDLTEERDALKTECIQLKSSEKSVDKLIVQYENSRVQLEETKRELNHEKELNANLKVQIQKIQDSNSELMLAVKDLDEMLENKNMDIACLTSELELSKSEKGNANELHQLKQEIAELSTEIEVYKQDREKIENYVEQLTHDYEALKLQNLEMSSMLEQNRVEETKAQDESLKSSATMKELEGHIERLEEKLKTQTQEFSESLLSVNDFERQVKGLEKELEKQAQNFENDLNEMMNAKIEQEQRAIRAEEALRKTRWKNAIAAEQLQEEFKTLSTEMGSKLNENEKVTAKALTESNELREQKIKLEESLEKTNEQLALLKEQNRIKVEEVESMAKQLKCAQKLNEENKEKFSAEIKMLKTKLETRTIEKNALVKQGEQKVKSGGRTAQMKIGKDEDSKLNKLSTELAMVKERNESMERELKEMEERYSEISLKFAEVEGERQQLVMTVRNLKNKKS